MNKDIIMLPVLYEAEVVFHKCRKPRMETFFDIIPIEVTIKTIDEAPVVALIQQGNLISDCLRYTDDGIIKPLIDVRVNGKVDESEPDVQDLRLKTTRFKQLTSGVIGTLRFKISNLQTTHEINIFDIKNTGSQSHEHKIHEVDCLCITKGILGVKKQHAYSSDMSIKKHISDNKSAAIRELQKMMDDIIIISSPGQKTEDMTIYVKEKEPDVLIENYVSNGQLKNNISLKSPKNPLISSIDISLPLHVYEDIKFLFRPDTTDIRIETQIYDAKAFNRSFTEQDMNDLLEKFFKKIYVVGFNQQLPQFIKYENFIEFKRENNKNSIVEDIKKLDYTGLKCDSRLWFLAKGIDKIIDVLQKNITQDENVNYTLKR